jgi:hypothetical protein
MSMTISEKQSHGLALRLRTSAPSSDESLSSILDRAASLWCISRNGLLRQLGHASAVEDLDAMESPLLLDSMAAALGMKSSALSLMVVPQHRLDVLIDHRFRNAYCPLCFEGDWKSGRTPYFRLDWGRLWATHCSVHRAPLFEWVAISPLGQRCLPHACHLPYTGPASLPIWISCHIKEALLWQHAIGEDHGTHDLWRALVEVEEAWWREGIGDPLRVASTTALRREGVLGRLAVLFLANRNPAQPRMAETILFPRHQYEVLGYNRRRQRQTLRRPKWRETIGHPSCGEFRRLLPSIQARRAVLMLTAHTLGQLDADLRFETGAQMPPGGSKAWASHIMSRWADRKLVSDSLRAREHW